jgi:hypothetical protein
VIAILCRGIYILELIMELYYSLRPILLFTYTDVSITKMCLDTSILAKSIMGRREYLIIQQVSHEQ